jgi:pimeloyl-ACP methyl ester carboxylesterase
MLDTDAPRLDPTADRGLVRSRDGTPIAWWRYEGDPEAGGAPGPQRGPSVGPAAGRVADGGGRGRGRYRDTTAHPAVLLVHGTTADHTTFRVVGPRLAMSRPTYALDRRGREASGDADVYSIEREYEDVAAVADALAGASGGRVAVVGHSYGGRCAMGAALIAPSIRRVVSYEGAVSPGVGAGDPELLGRLESLAAEGRREELLRAFLTEVVELTPAEWEAFRTSPAWPARLAAAGTVIRELRAGTDIDAAWRRYAGLRVPVLQLLGSESAAFFRRGAEARDARLGDGRIEVIEGARHAAHHTHAERFLELVEGFLDAPDRRDPAARPAPARNTIGK